MYRRERFRAKRAPVRVKKKPSRQESSASVLMQSERNELIERGEENASGFKSCRQARGGT
jgi:hypothetical protein